MVEENESFLLVVKADTDDGDYVTKVTEVKDVTILQRIRDIYEVIANCEQSHNWPTSEYADGTLEELYKGKLTEEDMYWFDNFVPYGEHGVHTIEWVIEYTVIAKREL